MSKTARTDIKMDIATWEKKLWRDKLKEQEKGQKKTEGYPWISAPPSDECSLQKHILFIHRFTSSLTSFLRLRAYHLSFSSGLLPGSGTVACFFCTHFFFNYYYYYYYRFCLLFPFFLQLFLALSIPPRCSLFCFFSAPSPSHILLPITLISGVMSLHCIWRTRRTYSKWSRADALLHCIIGHWVQSCKHTGINTHKHINK